MASALQFKSTPTTLAPFLLNNFAIAKPIPDDAPVTTTTEALKLFDFSGI